MPETPSFKLREPLPPPAGVTPGALPYAELDVTTNFSFLRGASHPDELVYTAAMLGHRAIAITDICTVAGTVRAHAAAKQCGMKLIVGARLTFADGTPDLLVWCPDRAAYGRLCRLLTIGKRRTEKAKCELYLDDLLSHSDGLLAAIDYRTPPTVDSPHYVDLLRSHLRGRLWLAVSLAYGPDDQSQLDRMIELSRRLRIPLVATNHVHYHDPGRRPVQDVLVCVREGVTIEQAGYRLFPNAERYLKPPEQMHRLFAACPSAVAATVEIADRCSFSMSELQYEYPSELVPAGRTAIEHLRELTWKGAAERFASREVAEDHSPGREPRVEDAIVASPEGAKEFDAHIFRPFGASALPGSAPEAYAPGYDLPPLRGSSISSLPDDARKLIESELVLIEQLKFEHYFLTVHDLVRFARSRGILCQGRGSAANSAVCYCLGVTSVDPSKIDLLFERFISAERGEPPDIDIDFEHERREEVIQYLYQKYGRDRAGLAAEVITYRGRSAIRDVGKALGLSLDMVDAMARKLDWWHRGVLDEQQIRETGLDPHDPNVRRVIAIATEVLGFPRHLGQHVGGMVMSRGPLCEVVPIENARMDDRTVVEWDKDDLEELGLLKVDVLGLGMLTCISKAFALLEKVEGRSLQLHTLPPEDPAVYDMICDADTIGVFQIESRAQMTMLPRLRPRSFYDIVIEVAIVRPGPIQGNMVHPYLRRRNGEETVSYPSEALRNVLQKTLGVPLFQEQAMRVAMVGAGFTGAEADQLRRAMAAWKKSTKLLHFHDRIINGMLKNGYTREFAEQCFEQIKGFGEYGFPESHSASFALLVYASAWLKRHHPAAFAAALINSQPMGFYQPAQIVRDAREHGVEVRPADVNESGWDCSLEMRKEYRVPRKPSSEDKTTWGIAGPALRLGLRMIKGLRSADAERLVASRDRGSGGGRFRSVDHFQRATGLSKKVLRRLAEADAFASLGLSRREALWEVMKLSDVEMPLYDSREAAKDHGQSREPHINDTSEPQGPLSPPGREGLLPRMPLGQEVNTDYATVGLSLRAHPLALVRETLQQQRIITAAEMNQLPHGRWVKVAGLVLIRQRPGTASGIVFVTLEDETGVVNLIVRPAIYDRYRPAARHAGLLQCDGYVERQGKVVHVMAKRLFDRSELIAGIEFASRDFH